MKNLDLYKLIVFASLLLIPAGGGWVWFLQQEIEVAKAAIRKATSGGQLEKIGLLQSQIDQIKSNIGTNDQMSHRIFFEKRILISASEGSIGNTDFTIGDERQTTVRKNRAVDYEVKIDFVRARKPLPLPRDFIHAVLFNCESPGMWKLRSIDLSNEEAGKANEKKPPPKTINDTWNVTNLVFARRAPDK